MSGMQMDIYASMQCENKLVLCAGGGGTAHAGRNDRTPVRCDHIEAAGSDPVSGGYESGALLSQRFWDWSIGCMRKKVSHVTTTQSRICAR